MVLEKIDIHTQENESRHNYLDLTTFLKINSKWNVSLNIKCKATKLLEDNNGENISDLRFDDNLLDTTPKK